MNGGGGLAVQGGAGVNVANTSPFTMENARLVQQGANGVNMMTQPGQQQSGGVAPTGGGATAPVARAAPIQATPVTAPSGGQGQRPSLAQILFGSGV